MTKPNRLGYLGSFAYDRGDAATRRIYTYLQHGFPVMLDSGAFSVMNSGARIDINEHTEWVRTWQQRNDTGTQLLCVALDVIGDPAATVRNYEKQIRDGAVVVPTIHYPNDPKQVDAYADSPSGWVNLGGMVRYFSKSHLDNVIAWCAAVISRTRKAGVKVHGLGATPPAIHWLIPFDSCDSTYWLSGSRFGQHSVFDPAIRDWRKIKTGSRAAYKYGNLLRDRYGLDPEVLDADTRGEAGRKLSERVAIQSHDIFAQTFRDRHDSDLIVHLAGGSPDLIGYQEGKQL